MKAIFFLFFFIHFKTTFICPRSIAGVPSSQALPGYLLTAPPSMYVPDVIGALVVWIQNQKKKSEVTHAVLLTRSYVI